MSRGSKPTQDSHAAGAGPQSRECKSVGAFLFAISAALVVLVWRAQGPTSNSETSNNMVAAAEAEHAVTPTPRTLWSSRQSSTALLQWLQYQQELANRTKTEGMCSWRTSKLKTIIISRPSQVILTFHMVL